MEYLGKPGPKKVFQCDGLVAKLIEHVVTCPVLSHPPGVMAITPRRQNHGTPVAMHPCVVASAGARVHCRAAPPGADMFQHARICVLENCHSSQVQRQSSELH